MVGRAITAMIGYFSPDRGLMGHSLKMYGYAKAIAEGEGLTGDELLVVELAAIFHDIGIPQSKRLHGSSAGPYQEKEGVAVAGPLLRELGCPEGLSERILFIIGHHHSLKTDGGLPLQIIFEADFIVNLEEGNLGEQTPENVRERFFRTETGRGLIAAAFGLPS